jgi:hypothetical protein
MKPPSPSIYIHMAGTICAKEISTISYYRVFSDGGIKYLMPFDFWEEGMFLFTHNIVFRVKRSAHQRS